MDEGSLTAGELSAPADFPWPHQTGAVSGSAPKVLLTLGQDGRYQRPPISDEERLRRWQYCEDLANQFAGAAYRSKQGKRAHLAEGAILEQYLPRLLQSGWTTEAEAKWILHRAATILGWADVHET